MTCRGGRFALMSLLWSMAACVPWTVRPIDEKREAASVSPVSYVNSIWDAQLVPAVMKSAVDARVLINALSVSPADALTRYGHREATGPTYFLVKGEGVVTRVDTQSRTGLALVDVAPFDRRADVSIQIGPVLRGTSLRDAPGIVHFTDFVNQLQFADVGNELNSRVLRTVLASVTPATLKGRIVSFAGTLAAEGAADPPLRELVPVRFAVEERK